MLSVFSLFSGETLPTILSWLYYDIVLFYSDLSGDCKIFMCVWECPFKTGEYWTRLAESVLVTKPR